MYVSSNGFVVDISVTNTLSCGHTLVGGTKVVNFTCTNTGGDGQFCVMGKDKWPTTDFKVK